ncbi:unannotated protein [freshwater metagenome]|uniref:Unannotated protein n=1 Tax=freshwater metagenome TaxID=449393 RepID=A0A6J6XK28_9ZZZZ
MASIGIRISAKHDDERLIDFYSFVLANLHVETNRGLSRPDRECLLVELNIIAGNFGGAREAQCEILIDVGLDGGLNGDGRLLPLVDLNRIGLDSKDRLQIASVGSDLDAHLVRRANDVVGVVTELVSELHGDVFGIFDDLIVEDRDWVKRDRGLTGGEHEVTIDGVVVVAVGGVVASGGAAVNGEVDAEILSRSDIGRKCEGE